jgi:hypothetical protein
MRRIEVMLLQLGLCCVAIGLLLLLEGCTADQGTNAVPDVETSQPTRSPPVAPGQSQDLRNIPTVLPPQPDSPVYEINPRAHPPSPSTPALPPSPPPTEAAG